MSAVSKRDATRLRGMTEADLAEIVPIERQAYPYPWPVSFFRHCLRSGHVCRVLEQDCAHFLNLCVRPELQGQGLGTRLLTDLLTLARRRGASGAALEVRPSNYAARNLYQRMGFAPGGVRKRYYPAAAGHGDALILTRSLRGHE